MDQGKTRFDELWKYIFSVFPLIDIPFGIFAIIFSKNWIATACMTPIFPIVATIIMKICAEKNKEPGPYIFTINGITFIAYAIISGPESPTWLMMINMTVGSSFLFNKPRIGQTLVFIFSIFLGFLFYFMGATIWSSLVIALALCSFTILFSRTFDYLKLQKQNIENKNREIEIQKQEIIDSINYAKRIQFAVLPNEENIYRAVPLSFIIYKPKDIVSGDFFWFHEIDENNYIIVCADCTGHGVPGALMTVIGSNLLNQIVIENKIQKTSAILSELDKRITATLKQQKDHYQIIHDGMDLSVLKVNKQNREFMYSSAKRPAVFIRDKQIQDFKGSKNSIGGLRSGDKYFEEICIKYNTDDVVYLYTDGIVDQFGGTNNKKYSTKKLKELLLNIHYLPIQQQKNKIDTELNGWMNGNEQTDDISIIGIRF